jgi:hypothetical protein
MTLEKQKQGATAVRSGALLAIPNMQATIYFIYQSEPARSFTCENTIKDIEGEIRYWMGKSPGMHEVEKIIVIPQDQEKDWMYVLTKMRDEEDAYEEKKRLEAEKQEYERLKSKYG